MSSGRPLTEFVAPEYVELVENNLLRRLAGESAAERYEIELMDRQGQVTRVELSSTVIDSSGEPALLLTALEMMPGAIPTEASQKPRAMATLDAMGESVITVDAEGRIDYINHSAGTAAGPGGDQVLGKSLCGGRLAGRRDRPPLARRSGAEGLERRRPRDHRPEARRAGAGERRHGAVRRDQRHAAAAPTPRISSGLVLVHARHQRAARPYPADDLSGEPRSRSPDW